MQMGHDVPFAFNRKEAKDHGEGGTLVGAPLKGKVLIIDDVISAGTSVRESVELIRAQGAEPAGVIIALDRMERGGDAVNPTENSAVHDVKQTYGLEVISIANLNGLLQWLNEQAQTSSAEPHSAHADLQRHAQAVQAYRERWGA